MRHPGPHSVSRLRSTLGRMRDADVISLHAYYNHHDTSPSQPLRAVFQCLRRQYRREFNRRGLYRRHWYKRP